MKKNFTLLAMGLMMAPVINAVDKDITISLNQMTEVFTGTEIVTNIEKIAEIQATLSYDEATKQYVIPSFLGYKDANNNPISLQFSIDAEAVTDYGDTRYLLFAYEPDCDPTKAPAENNLRYSWRNNWYNSFYLPLPENPNSGVGGVTTTDFEPHMSAIFAGEDYDYKLYTPYYWMCVPQKRMPGISQRTYATLGADGSYNVTIEGSSACYYRKLHDSDAWPTTIYEDPDNGDRELVHQLTFTFNPSDFVGGDTPSAIEDINVNDENAPVEYFNLQGVRVENPTAGLYICRQGNKVTKKVIM